MKTLMFENTADVGDTIKAYDFAPRAEHGDCYIEGVVRDKGLLDKPYKCYEIKITKRVWNGFDTTEKSKDKICYIPFESSDDGFNKEYFTRQGLVRVKKLN